MSSGWHWFVIAGTVGSLVIFLWLLFANRKISGNETTGHEADGIEELDNPLPMWWVGMFVISILFSFGYLIYYPGLGNFEGTGGWSSAKQLAAEDDRHEARFAPLYANLAQQDVAALHQDRLAQQVGRRLFVNNCATCHGSTAQGSPGFPNLTDSEWIWGRSFEDVKHTLTFGRVAAMAPWGPALGDQGVADVTQTVLRMAGKDHDPAAAERGSESYRTFCVACHGVDGKGNAALGAPDLTNDIWLYGGDAATIALTIREGRMGNMPSQADMLTPEKIHILAAYVTALSKP